MESFREAASNETHFSLDLRKGKFCAIILAIRFYCGDKKEHLFCRIFVTMKKTTGKELRKKTKQKKQLLLDNVLFC